MGKSPGIRVGRTRPGTTTQRAPVNDGLTALRKKLDLWVTNARAIRNSMEQQEVLQTQIEQDLRAAGLPDLETSIGLAEWVTPEGRASYTIPVDAFMDVAKKHKLDKEQIYSALTVSSTKAKALLPTKIVTDITLTKEAEQKDPVFRVVDKATIKSKKK